MEVSSIVSLALGALILAAIIGAVLWSFKPKSLVDKRLRKLAEEDVRSRYERQERLHVLRRTLTSLLKSYDSSKDWVLKRKLVHQMNKIRAEIDELTQSHPPGDA